MRKTQKILSRFSRSRSLRSGLLGGAAVLSLWSANLGCTRVTPGFCNLDEECQFGQFCALPAHECTSGMLIRGEFSGGQMLPPTASPSEGSFALLVSENGGPSTYTFKHNVPNPTKLELFLGRVGKNGTRIRELPLDGTGSLMLDPDTVRAMKVGDYYLQLSSNAFTNGELRAQLFSLNPEDGRDVVMLSAPLSGRVSSPGNDSPARGRVQITLDEQAGTVAYSLQHSGLQGMVTGLHLHRGGFNINGPHVLDLPASPVTPLSGVLGANDVLAQLQDPTLYRSQKHLWRMLIKSGLTYLNVHSDKFVKGELRGQLVPSLAVPFNVPLRPPMGSASQAQGEGQFYLSEDGATLAFRLSHSVTNVTSASLVKGPVGARMKLDCSALTMSAGADKAQGYCQVAAAAMNNVLDISSLRQGSIWLLIHSSTAPMGEIEGQLVVPVAQ
ncbi:MAG: CHRD domain-containing protein [Myxococcales bacterium]|nr:CHRD domain-containing protein [Myxococcales bacterium]